VRVVKGGKGEDRFPTETNWGTTQQAGQSNIDNGLSLINRFPEVDVRGMGERKSIKKTKKKRSIYRRPNPNIKKKTVKSR